MKANEVLKSGAFWGETEDAGENPCESGEGIIDVLIVDDERVICRMLSSYLRRRGWRVESFLHPVEALLWYRTNKEFVRCVLLDFHMPSLNGGEVLRIVRELEPGVRVAMMSADSEEELVEQFLR